ncbi:MAG: hypothetical protein IKU03_09925 [Bacteroidales bacterium]|nr:hypothetical protein [Bacteroidales bacterium]
MAKAKSCLKSTGKWMKFFFILLVVLISFLVIGGITFLVWSVVYGNLPNSDIPFWYLSFILLVSVAIYAIPLFSLYKCIKALDKVIQDQDNKAMVDFFHNNLSLWIFLGIFTILVISIYIILYIVSMVAHLVATL